MKENLSLNNNPSTIEPSNKPKIILKTILFFKYFPISKKDNKIEKVNQ